MKKFDLEREVEGGVFLPGLTYKVASPRHEVGMMQLHEIVYKLWILEHR
jgi:hypothetical protein